MTETSVGGSALIDRVDGQIVHALQLSPRASYARIGAAVGVSEQTVARRYRRLRTAGLFRVIALVDPRATGQTSWMVRIGVRPGSAAPLSQALADRDDVSWVTIMAGGAEVLCTLNTGHGVAGQTQSDLLERVPRTSTVLSMTAHARLHRFVGPSPLDFVGFGPLLDQDQQRRLGESEPARRATPITSLDPGDGPLLDALARDGRAGIAELAALTGWSPGQLTRRLAGLVAGGLLYFDVDMALPAIGFRSSSVLWLTVAPPALVAVGEQLAAHDEVPFAGAYTGPANIVATVICRDSQELYEFVTTKVAALDEVRSMEISPTLRHVKAAGSLVVDGRLSTPRRRMK